VCVCVCKQEKEHCSECVSCDKQFDVCVPHCVECICKCVLQCVAVCCSALQCVAVCCSVLDVYANVSRANRLHYTKSSLAHMCVVLCGSVLQSSLAHMYHTNMCQQGLPHTYVPTRTTTHICANDDLVKYITHICATTTL